MFTDEDIEKLVSDEMQPKPVDMKHLMMLEREMPENTTKKLLLVQFATISVVSLLMGNTFAP